MSASTPEGAEAVHMLELIFGKQYTMAQTQKRSSKSDEEMWARRLEGKKRFGSSRK